MYEEDLKYIAISYRWGELNEQPVKTPDYTAHITSFDLYHLKVLCNYIKKEQDLKEIRHLWVDAISVNQHHHARKKETILKMNDIYKRATYILAIPDLHLEYLKYNPANKDTLDLVDEYKFTIYEEIINSETSSLSPSSSSTTKNNKKEVKNNKIKISHNNNNNNKKGIEKAYQYLAYLIEDWSNRAWVISEYHIAKEKEGKKGTPLKYMFMSLMRGYINNRYNRFFLYSFDHDHYHHHHHQRNNNRNIHYSQVKESKKFIKFLKTRFTKRHHLDMLLNSNATRNEDRFHAILPSWKNHQHLIKNKNTISEWNITNMTSVRLKLYEIMDDVWDKARLLKACSHQSRLHSIILPSFATHSDSNYLHLIEKDSMEEANKLYLNELNNYEKRNGIIDTTTTTNNNTNDGILYIKSGLSSSSLSSLLFTENLISIQLNHHYLSIKPNIFFL